jgi:hypothetical protein
VGGGQHEIARQRDAAAEVSALSTEIPLRFNGLIFCYACTHELAHSVSLGSFGVPRLWLCTLFAC